VRTAALSLAAVTLLLALSCATAIPVTLVKPPELDMGGIKTIAVLPFGYGSDGLYGDPLQVALSRLLNPYRYVGEFESQNAVQVQNRFIDALLASNAYTVVTGSELLKNALQGRAGGVDAYISGEINMAHATDETSFTDIKGSDGVVRKTFTLTRKARFEFTYRVIRTADGRIIGQRSKAGTASSVAYGDRAYTSIASAESLVRDAMRSSFGDIHREVAPWTSTEFRQLVKDSGKNEALERADALVKKGQYREALAIYQSTYAAGGNFAAGYNAAIMTEILGDLAGAISLMDALYSATGNPKAANELRRMRQTQADNARLQETR
jgi:hypothetical protein